MGNGMAWPVFAIVFGSMMDSLGCEWGAMILHSWLIL
jgi:hypothetical protein